MAYQMKQNSSTILFYDLAAKTGFSFGWMNNDNHIEFNHPGKYLPRLILLCPIVGGGSRHPELSQTLNRIYEKPLDNSNTILPVWHALTVDIIDDSTTGLNITLTSNGKVQLQVRELSLISFNEPRRILSSVDFTLDPLTDSPALCKIFADMAYAALYDQQQTVDFGDQPRPLRPWDDRAFMLASDTTSLWTASKLGKGPFCPRHNPNAHLETATP